MEEATSPQVLGTVRPDARTVATVSVVGGDARGHHKVFGTSHYQQSQGLQFQDRYHVLPRHTNISNGPAAHKRSRWLGRDCSHLTDSDSTSWTRLVRAVWVAGTCFQPGPPLPCTAPALQFFPVSVSFIPFLLPLRPLSLTACRVFLQARGRWGGQERLATLSEFQDSLAISFPGQKTVCFPGCVVALC